MSHPIFVSQETAQWTLRHFNLTAAHAAPTASYPLPPQGVKGLMIAAANLEPRAVGRLEMAFPEIVQAVNFTKTTDGIDILRAIAANGVPE